MVKSPSTAQGCICVLLGSVLLLAACSDRRDPIKIKDVGQIAAVSAPPVRANGTPETKRDEKSLAGVLDAYKTGEADYQKYSSNDTNASQASSGAPEPLAYKGTSRMMPILPLSERKPKPTIPGGERPGDIVGKRAGDEKR